MNGTSTPERLAVLETKVSGIEDTVNDTRGDVKQLLTWHAEERGVRRFLAWGIPIALTVLITIGLKVLA